MHHVSRREFFTTALKIAGGLGAVGLIAPALSAVPSVPAHLTLYDERFARAFKLASRMAGSGALRVVQGDATSFASLLHRNDTVAAPIVIQGVTTESVPFCLHQLCRTGQRPALQIQRVDQDLFTWTLRSEPWR